MYNHIHLDSFQRLFHRIKNTVLLFSLIEQQQQEQQQQKTNDFTIITRSPRTNKT